jgi:hypothetical protein
MRYVSAALLCVCIALSSGCSLISTALTPASVVDSVARGYTVSKAAVESPPATSEDLQAYFEVNAELWKQLAIWYELLPQEE